MLNGRWHPLSLKGSSSPRWLLFLYLILILIKCYCNIVAILIASDLGKFPSWGLSKYKPQLTASNQTGPLPVQLQAWALKAFSSIIVDTLIWFRVNRSNSFTERIFAFLNYKNWLKISTCMSVRLTKFWWLLFKSPKIKILSPGYTFCNSFGVLSYFESHMHEKNNNNIIICFFRARILAKAMP